MRRDTDGDLVNDACDPRPDVAGDSIGFFASFATSDSPFMRTTGTPTYDDDDLVALATPMGRTVMKTMRLPTCATYVIGGRLTAVGPSRQQLTIGLDNPSDECQGGRDRRSRRARPLGHRNRRRQLTRRQQR